MSKGDEGRTTDVAHTPGPWWVLEEGFGAYVMHHDKELGSDFPVTSFGLPSRSANLALMAAAPDLLEALQEVLAAMGNFTAPDNHPSHVAWPKAHAAIALATGGRA